MTSKPINDSGLFCPLWRRKTEKVCHTCELWRALPVGRSLPGGKLTDVHDQWACAYVLSVGVGVEIVKSVDGVQKAEESFRNQAWSESQQNLRDIVQLAKHWDKRLGGLPPPELKLIGG